jgi:hypothetical protein
MAEIVNLRRARKKKSRAGKRGAADANAAKFGRSKAQKRLQDAEATKAERDLSGHKRETPDD